MGTRSIGLERPRVLDARLLLWVAVLLSVSLLPRAGHAKGAEEPSQLWCSVQGGLSLNGTVTLEGPLGFLNLEASEGSSAAFGMSFFYRTSRIDLGLSFEHMGGGRFRGVQRDRGVGGKARVAMLFTWRYFKEAWGGFYLGLSPGLVMANHSVHMQSQVATALGRQPTQLSGIDAFNSGFGIGSSLGMFFHLNGNLSVFAESMVLVANFEMRSGAEAVEYISTQPLFQVGLTARL
jgi:hypothetical protein